MSATPNSTYTYQVGGSLDVEHPTYVVRQADKDLYDRLKGKEFCYVLNSRQMGKSSLRVQTMYRLQAQGIACAEIDLTAIGSQQVTAQQWYGGIIQELVSSFHLKVNRRAWWCEHEHLAPVQCFSEFIKTVLLAEVSQNLVIFIDEIDSVLNLNFPIDDFFAAIRACYNKRASQPEYKRLTFALLGVATPSDLIQDRNRTPFNIGRAIQLEGFRLEEAKALANGLVAKASSPQAVLKAVLAWTGGQPFLTQKLCQLILKSSSPIPTNGEVEWVENLVRKQVIENWEFQDEPEHLLTIRDRLLSSGQSTGRMLGLYQKVLQHAEVAADESPEQMELQLSGLAIKRAGKLRVYNLIYKSVFSLNWVEKELASLRPSFYSEALEAWLASNSQEESWLLRGQALRNAQTWAAGKSLSTQDYQFLAASLELEQREVRRNLEAERDRLNRRIIKWLTIGVLVALTLAGLAGVQWWRVQQERQKIFAHSLVDRAELTRRQPDLLPLSVALSLEAMKQFDSVETKPFMYDDLALLPRSRPPIKKHRGSVNAVAFSQTGKYLVTAGLAENTGSQGNACVWEVTGSRQLNCVSHGNSVNAVAFSPDEKNLALATASSDGKACVWEASSGRKIQCIEHDLGANAVAFSPDGKYLATAGADGQVKVLKTTSYKLVRLLQHSASVIAITFSPDSKSLAAASLDGKAYVWDLTSGDKVTVLVGHEDSVNAVAFSPKDGKYLATASADRTVRLWDLSSGNSSQLANHQGGVVAVTFSPDGQYLATASLDGTAQVWSDWKSTSSKKQVITHRGPVISVVFSQDGKYLATASSDNTARMWEIATGYEFTRMIHKDGVNAIAFSPDRKFLVTASLDGTARLWEIDGDRTVALMRHNAQVTAMAFSQDGKYLATASNDKTARLWSAASGYEEVVLPQQEAVSFSPNSKYLATVNSNNTVTVWKTDTGKKALPSTLGEDVNSVAFSPDDRYLATASLDGSAQLWRVSNGEKFGQLMQHRQSVTTVAFSQDGKYLATASRDETACIWEISTDNKVTKVRCVGHDAFVESVAFSPDSKLLATGSRDGRVKVLEIHSSKKLVELQHDGPVTALVFSPNGKYLATVSGDNTARVWELTQSNTPVATMQHDGPVTAVAFSPDGIHLATASKDNTARVWETLNDLMPVEIIPHWQPVTGVVFSSDSDGERLATMSGKTVRVLFWQREKLSKNACAQLTCEFSLGCQRSTSFCLKHD